MKIVHAIRSLDPATGGPATVVVGLAMAQQALGHEVIILQEDSCCGEAQLLQHEQLNECTNPLKIINLALELAPMRVLERLQPEILHLHGVWCSLVRRLSAQARRIGLPYVQATHGTLSPWSLRSKKLKKKVALKLIYRKILDNAVLLHANSSNEYQELINLGFKTQIALVPNGLSEDEYHESVDARIFLDKFRKTNQRPFILFLGRIATVKAPDLLVRAFEILAMENADIDLVIAGPDGGMLGDIQNQLATLTESVQERIQLTGPLYGIDKHSALKACTILCLPSKYESFGMVIIEAMNSERTVVCTEECGFDDVENAAAGLVVKGTQDALARALLKAVQNENWRNTAGSNGRQLVRTKYLWPRIAQQLLQLYTEHI